MTLNMALDVLAVLVPTVAVLLAWRSIRKQAVADARAAYEVQGLSDLADGLARIARDLREALDAPGCCTSCGRGVSARRLQRLAGDADRLVDLALLHVRDEELTRRVQRVAALAESARRHEGPADDACDELLRDVVVLTFACDQAAAATVAFIRTGEATPISRERVPAYERVAGWLLDRVIRIDTEHA